MGLCLKLESLRHKKSKENNIISHHYMQKVHPKIKNTQKTHMKLSNLEIMFYWETHLLSVAHNYRSIRKMIFGL
jgi:hypothetical protein